MSREIRVARLLLSKPPAANGFQVSRCYDERANMASDGWDEQEEGFHRMRLYPAKGMVPDGSGLGSCGVATPEVLVSTN